MTKAKLVILRHGEASGYSKLQVNGQRGIPLSEEGEAQARVAGQLISDIPFSAAYSSTLLRAFNTAALALEAAGQEMPVEQREAIIEKKDVITYSQDVDFDSTEYFKSYIYNSAPQGGESDKQVVVRVQKFFDEEVQPRLARGENVLVVAHAGTIRAFDMVLGLAPTPADGGVKPEARPVPNATPAVHEYEDGVLKKSYDIANPETEKADKAYRKAATERAAKWGV